MFSGSITHATCWQLHQSVDHTYSSAVEHSSVRPHLCPAPGNVSLMLASYIVVLGNQGLKKQEQQQN